MSSAQYLYSVNSDYRTVASAVNSGVPVSALRVSELNGQLETIARALAGLTQGRREKSDVRSVSSYS